MKQSRDQKRAKQLKEKQQRQQAQGQKLEEKRFEQLRTKLPKFDSIKVLSLGEGSESGFAHRLAQRYLEHETPSRIVSIDLQPITYSPPVTLRT